MEGKTNIAVNLAPKGWKDFRRWHKAACPSDPLTSEERFVKEGGKLPEKNVSKSNTRTSEKK